VYNVSRGTSDVSRETFIRRCNMKHNKSDLLQMQSLPLESKIIMTKTED